MNINHLRLILERAAPAPLTIILETVESQMYREILPYDGNITKLILSDSAGRRQWSSPYFSELPELKLTSLQTFIAQGNHAHDFPILRFLTMASHSQCTNMSLHFALPDAREMSNLMELQVMQRVITLTIKFGKNSVFQVTIFLNPFLTRQPRPSDTPSKTFHFSPRNVGPEWKIGTVVLLGHAKT